MQIEEIMQSIDNYAATTTLLATATDTERDRLEQEKIDKREQIKLMISIAIHEAVINAFKQAIQLITD